MKCGEIKQGMPHLEQLRINGIAAFLEPESDVSYRIEEAHALLTILAAAYRVCDDADERDTDTLLSLRPGIISRGLEGIATLLALGQHHADVVDVKKGGR